MVLIYHLLRQNSNPSGKKQQKERGIPKFKPSLDIKKQHTNAVTSDKCMLQKTIPETIFY